MHLTCVELSSEPGGLSNLNAACFAWSVLATRERGSVAVSQWLERFLKSWGKTTPARFSAVAHRLLVLSPFARASSGLYLNRCWA